MLKNVNITNFEILDVASIPQGYIFIHQNLISHQNKELKKRMWPLAWCVSQMKTLFTHSYFNRLSIFFVIICSYGPYKSTYRFYLFMLCIALEPNRTKSFRMQNWFNVKKSGYWTKQSKLIFLCIFSGAWISRFYLQEQRFSVQYLL